MSSWAEYRRPGRSPFERRLSEKPRHIRLDENGRVSSLSFRRELLAENLFSSNRAPRIIVFRHDHSIGPPQMNRELRCRGIACRVARGNDNLVVIDEMIEPRAVKLEVNRITRRGLCDRRVLIHRPIEYGSVEV